MAVLTTGDLNLPAQILDPWLGKVQYGSAVAALSNSTPMKFGAGQSFSFDIGEAEYVGEGQNKGPSTVAKVPYTVGSFKFHKTVRWTDEVMWADDDYQLGVVSQILDLMSPALSRALDFGVFHGINPTGGAKVPVMSTVNLDSLVTNEVEIAAGAKPYASLDAADALVMAGGFVPSDVALDPTYAGGFTALRSTATEQKLYPNLKLSTEVGELDGHRSSVSRTVGAVGVAAAATNAKSYVGDFSAVRWGIQKALPLEVIEFGDPDGQGDLKRNNQVAFRVEVVYGWGIGDKSAFARIVDKVV